MTASLPDTSRRTVITGIGVVAPNGIGTEKWWSATLLGLSGIRRITRFDPSRYATQHAGEVDGFDPNDYIERRIIVQTDRWTWMSLAAAEMALSDACFDPAKHDPYSMSVITANATGGNEFGQVEIQKLWARGPRFVGAYQSIAWFYAAATGQISIRYGIKGPCSVVAAEGAGGLEALAHARRTSRRGIQMVVCGGLEAPLGPYALTCQLSNPALTRAPGVTAYRPFDARASGYLPGEGGAILVLEELEAARQRGAPQIYGEILGYGATNDAFQAVHRATNPRQCARAIALALHDAGIDPTEVDAVFADGAGTLHADAIELRAIRAVLGQHATRVPITVPKSMTGRLYAGAGALDVAAGLLAIRDGVLPPTINLEEPVSADLNFVQGAKRKQTIATVLVIARGCGGFNSALVLRRPP
jgi:3-oxoacyl-(acyl-carrier-protein) synthase